MSRGRPPKKARAEAVSCAKLQGRVLDGPGIVGIHADCILFSPGAGCFYPGKTGSFVYTLSPGARCPVQERDHSAAYRYRLPPLCPVRSGSCCRGEHGSILVSLTTESWRSGRNPQTIPALKGMLQEYLTKRILYLLDPAHGNHKPTEQGSSERAFLGLKYLIY